MSFIKSCYYSSMRLYRDRPDIITRGRWHWCPPGARAIPYFHLFGSFNQDTYRESIDPPVGEIPRKQGRSNGKTSIRYTGQNWCGDEFTWTHGALISQRGTPAVDAEGIPVCCQSGPPTPGGNVAGGSALWRTPNIWLPIGSAGDIGLSPIAEEAISTPIGSASDIALSPIAEEAISTPMGIVGDIVLVPLP